MTPGGSLRTSTFALAFLALLTLPGLTGCRAASDLSAALEAVPEEERYGGTVVIGAAADLQSMNALTSSDYNSATVQRELLFMPLIKYDANLDPVPWLAERWDTVRVAADSLELTWYLRQDLLWHDGQPTTAQDLVFTYERMLDPRTAFPDYERLARYARRVEALDPHTVRMWLAPHAEFLDIWYQTPIMPHHLLGEVPPDQLGQHPFAQQPVGNGPFRFVRRLAGREWVFAANPDFPEALGGRPYLDEVVYRYIPEGTTLLGELLSGGIDVYLGPPPEQAEQIRQAAAVRLLESPFRQWVYLGWNTRRPPFQDARVRRALTLAIDREQIVHALLYGYADVGRSPVTPAHWSFDPDDPQTLLPYDTLQARQLLAEAGWRQGPDGLLRNEQGEEFRFTLTTNAGSEVRREVLANVQAQLRSLGIVLQPRLIERSALTSLLQSTERDFDAVVASWVDYFQKDDSGILHSRNVDGPYAYVGYADPRVDSLLDALIATMDRGAAAPLWQEYQRLLVHEAPYTVLYYPRRLSGVRNRLQGAEMDIRGELPTVARWWIPPHERRDAAPAAAALAAPAATPGTP